jgi:hypothetical protein
MLWESLCREGMKAQGQRLWKLLRLQIKFWMRSIAPENGAPMLNGEVA